MRSAFILLGLLTLGLVALAVWRAMDERAAQRMVSRLLALREPAPRQFSEEMIADLPSPVQRYFRFAIAPGTPLARVAEIEMEGVFRLGEKDAPRPMRMSATQVLALPDGFIWRMSARSGAMMVSGSDSLGWTRFRAMGLLPVARTGGTPDHQRSAFARLLMEAVAWTPAALLPSPDVRWRAVDDMTIAVAVTYEGEEEEAFISVDSSGRPIAVWIQRWTDANAEKTFRRQPFGGTLSGHRVLGGFGIATKVEVGNFYGTEAYFPFFSAEITKISFDGALIQ